MKNHFTELQNHYALWLNTLGFSYHVVYSNPKILHYFFEYIKNKGIYHITHLKSNHITDYFNYLQTRPNMLTGKALSVAHLNKSFDAIDKFLEFLHAQDYHSIPPPTHYRIIETKSDTARKVKALSRKEIQLLYNNVPNTFAHFTFKQAEHRRALAMLVLDLCYGCGLRKSELYNLLIENIDLDKKLLFVKQAKGYKDRYVPMSLTITERTKLFIYQHRKSFNVKHNRLFPLTLYAIPLYFKILLKASGLKYGTRTGLHTLRHSIATHLLQNGMSIEQIAKFLGHSTLDSTQVYTHLINDDEQ